MIEFVSHMSILRKVYFMESAMSSVGCWRVTIS